jgi:hypothetical protein
MLKPLLIGELTTDSIDFENITLGQDSIMDIIANKPVNYPFSIAIYSAFFYTILNIKTLKMLKRT